MANIQIYGTLPGGGSDIEIATEINAQSTNEKAAGAKAVYDALPTNFTGTDGTANGTNGLVPAPTTSDVDKFLNSDGTWKEASGGGGYPGVFEVQLDEVFGLENVSVQASAQKSLQSTELSKFVDIITYWVTNPGLTPVLLLKSKRASSGTYDKLPAVFMICSDYYTQGTTRVDFNAMSVIHPRYQELTRTISDLQLFLFFQVNNGVVTVTNAILNRSNYLTLEYENNKVTSITSSSTDTQYPSAKAVYSLQQEDIILEGDSSWLMGGTVTFDDAEDITKLNHFKELTLAGKHPRFGFSMNYLGSISTLLKEPDEVMTVEDDGTIVNFTTTFTAFLPNNYGLFGIQLDYASDSWSMTISSLNQS